MPVLQVMHRVIAIFLIKRVGVKRSHTGAVTLIERAGSVAALNPHPYCLVSDCVVTPYYSQNISPNISIICGVDGFVRALSHLEIELIQNFPKHIL